MTQAIILGELGLHSGSLIADTVLAQTTFPESYFKMKPLELAQYYHYQSRLGVKTLS